MNACDTAALSPDKAMNLLEGFMYRGAGAIIGTEITIFNSLAYAFASAFLDTVTGTTDGQPATAVGTALRLTRLELLRRWNPLGLAYVLYGLADATLANPI